MRLMLAHRWTIQMEFCFCNWSILMECRSLSHLNIDSFSEKLVSMAMKEKLTGMSFIPKGKFQHVISFVVKKLFDFGSHLKEDPSTHAEINVFSYTFT